MFLGVTHTPIIWRIPACQKFLGTLNTCAHGMRKESNFAWSRNCIREIILQDRPRHVPWPKIFASRVLTLDLFAIANLLVRLQHCMTRASMQLCTCMINLNIFLAKYIRDTYVVLLHLVMATTICHWYGKVPIYTTAAEAEWIRGELMSFFCSLRWFCAMIVLWSSV